MRKSALKEYPGYYITDTGVVYNNRGLALKGWLWQHGNNKRRRVTLFIGKGKKNRKVVSVARLVGKYFVPNPDNKPEINHKDTDTTNDYYTNLEWVTRKENLEHAHKHGKFRNYVPVKIIHKKTKLEKGFKSIAECSRFLGLKRACNIHQAIKEPQRTVKGYYIRNAS